MSNKEGLVQYDFKARCRFQRAPTTSHVEPRGKPDNAEVAAGEKLKLLSVGDKQFNEQDDNDKTFVEFLKSWGGEWTWDGLKLSEDPLWVAECLKNKMLVCVTDGSYNKQVAPDVCSAGWAMACTQTKRKILGTLLERSNYAGSYRGELLGMLAIQLFLLAVEEYHNPIFDGNEVCCDNKGALFTFEKESKRVPTDREQIQTFIAC